MTAASPHNALATFSTTGKTTFPGLILNITSVSSSPNTLPQSKPSPSTSFASALPHPSQCPFLLPYSWPDSFYEFCEMIAAFTAPTEGEYQGLPRRGTFPPGILFRLCSTAQNRLTTKYTAHIMHALMLRLEYETVRRAGGRLESSHRSWTGSQSELQIALWVDPSQLLPRCVSREFERF